MIEIKDLTKNYGKQNIFNHVNFTFPINRLVCLLGASGCGKSTLLNLIAGFDRDYQGDIIVYGSSIKQMSEDELCLYRRNHIGFIFQNYNLLKGYTVIENILLSCKQNNRSDIENKEKTYELLKQLNIADKTNQKIENLSGGQKQRVAIARALINDPSIILADEPTGALDRKQANEIMELLKEIAKDHLVLVITHDQKICQYADQIVSIEDGNIVGETNKNTFIMPKSMDSKKSYKRNDSTHLHALKNFKVHINRYIGISLAISIGVLAFMLSLSSNNIMKEFMVDFKEKNIAYNNGYIKIEKDQDNIINILQEDDRIENIYKQHVIKNVNLIVDGKTEKMEEKYPMPRALENMSYGVMPRSGQNKIALSPSLAKKFSNDISKLINKNIILHYNDVEYKLTISGIFNADYDDFYISPDIDKRINQHLKNENPYSISYDVKEFKDIVDVDKMLSDKGIEPKSAVKEVAALQSTFDNLTRLFLIVSILILSIGLFISSSLLVKLQNSRYKEIGLLSALGFYKKQIKSIIVYENIFLSLMASSFNALAICVTYLLSNVIGLNLILTLPQLIVSILATGLLVITISILSSYKLIHTEPAVALRK